MTDKLSLVTDFPKTINHLEQCNVEMKKNLPYLIEYAKLLAEMRKASYDAHMEQGFSEEQAMKLCTIISL